MREVRAIVLKSTPPQWRITAEGFVSSSGWTQARLEPRAYTVLPADGVQDFDFVANPLSGISRPVLTPVAAHAYWPAPSADLRGVRVYGVENFVELAAEDVEVLIPGTDGLIMTETHAQCVARIKESYPVHPANINTQKELIELECGKPQ